MMQELLNEKANEILNFNYLLDGNLDIYRGALMMLPYHN